MNMHFERYRAQRFIEGKLGCPSGKDFNQFKSNLKSLTLTNPTCETLQELFSYDAIDLADKGLQSLFMAISDVRARRCSWAVIKLYYSCYYFLRAELYLKGIGIVRCGSLFQLNLQEGEKPIMKGGNDHDLVITTWCSTFKSSDFLLSNKILNMHSYEWIKSNRERVQYRQRGFSEPNLDSIFQVYSENILKEIEEINNDRKSAKHFDVEYGIISIPLRRAIDTINSLEKLNLKLPIAKLNSLKSIDQNLFNILL